MGLLTQTPLTALAEAAGVLTSYEDVFGKPHAASERTLRTILTALHFDVADDARTQRSLEAFRLRARTRVLEPFYVVPAGSRTEIAIVLPTANPPAAIGWSLVSEDGRVREGAVRLSRTRVVETVRAGAASFEVRNLDLGAPLSDGYYDLEIRIGDRTVRSRVIVAPPSCYVPAALEERGIWGIAAQVYALRSERRAFAGDFRDLRDLCTLVRDAGGGAVAINPLHLLPRGGQSPYGPSSRSFLNWTYLECAALPDYEAADEDETRAGNEAEAEDGALVDYAALYDTKWRVARACFDRFMARASGDRARFDAYVRIGGRALQRSAVFQALADRFRQHLGNDDWRTWPVAFRDPASPAVTAFAIQAEREVAFYAYLQWQCDEQLKRAAVACDGMPVGIYRDIAVGTQLGGCDTWLASGMLVHDVAVGAPPDLLNRSGQDWGVAPFDPIALREAGYRPFADLIRANARHAGALRIDHVMGLLRLWWVPAGSPASEGAYVTYPLNEMLAVLALESRRARCLIVGEDLGTVPPGFRERLSASNVLSYRILQFEHDDERFFAPCEYPQNALVAVGTHDLPPMGAYWSGSDIDTRARIGTLPKSGVAKERDGRARARAQLQRAFAEALGDAATGRRIEDVAHAYLAKTQARMLLVALEDVLGDAEQINMPATTTQYPNWRHRSAVTIEALRTDDRFVRLARALREDRGS